MYKLIIISLILLVGTGNYAISLECDNTPFPVEVLRTQHIFEGQAIGVEEVNGEIMVCMKIDYTFKGDTFIKPNRKKH